MNVRVGLPGDLVMVMPMLRQHLALHERWDRRWYALRPDADAQFQRWLSAVSEDPRALLFVAEEDGRIVKFLAAVIETDVPIYRCDGYAGVFALWVEAAQRRRGAATALLELAAREYAAMGVQQTRIHTGDGEHRWPRRARARGHYTFTSWRASRNRSRALDLHSL